MDSVDITDLTFSLGNIPYTNDILTSTSDIISSTSDIISETISEFAPEFAPEFVPEFVPEFAPEFVPELVAIDQDNSMFIYFSIGFIIILIGIFIYKYYSNKNKQVRFQDDSNICYDDSSFCRRSEF